MKICFAAYEGVILAKGGPYTKIIQTKKVLEESGHKVDLLNLWENNSLKDYDIIHLVGANISTYGFARNLMLRNIKFLTEPVFFSLHSPSAIKRVINVQKFLRRYLKGLWTEFGIIKEICDWSELILPNTEAEKQSLIKSFSQRDNKIEVVPNGVSSHFINADPGIFINKYGIKDFILTVGHIGPKRKNILTLIKALNKINHPAVIIGPMLESDESFHVKEEIKTNKNIIYIDEIPNNSELLASAYAACGCFVLPSLYETPGIAALEAALAGAKIVITPYGGTKEYFRNWAEYIDPHSSDSIRKGIENSLNKKNDDNLKNFIKENFLWEKVAEKSIKIYSRHLNRV